MVRQLVPAGDHGGAAVVVPLDPRPGADPDQGARQPCPSAATVVSTAAGAKLSAPSGPRTCRWSSAAPAVTAATASSTIASTVTGRRE